jgi:alginate O-acetyltransferase complex protein AlgI
MSFTSYQFILVYLPLAYLGFVGAHRFGGWSWAIKFLAVLSLAFYAMFGLTLLIILLASLAFNYAAGNVIASLKDNPTVARNSLFGAIAINLGMLGYLKYTNFFIDIANQMSGSSYAHHDILVPLGVSFFTFIQIGYLIDAYNGQLIKHDLARYIVFAAFFPVVTAGPLVMQREMMEQMDNPQQPAFDLRRLIVGLTALCWARVMPGLALSAIRCNSISTSPVIPIWQLGLAQFSGSSCHSILTHRSRRQIFLISGVGGT